MNKIQAFMEKGVFMWIAATFFLTMVGTVLPLEGAVAGTAIDNVVMEVRSDGRATVEVTNTGPAPMGYVVTPFDWTVEDGEDVYTETQSFMAVPPTFQLAPGQTMTVRVGFRNPSPSQIERSFRLSIREVPTETAEEGLTFAYNHFLPVYIAPVGGREPINVRWSLVQDNGDWFLRAINEGNSRAVVRRLRVGNVELPTRAAATILARSWREYPLPASAFSAGSVRLQYEFTNGSSGAITLMR